MPKARAKRPAVYCTVSAIYSSAERPLHCSLYYEEKWVSLFVLDSFMADAILSRCMRWRGRAEGPLAVLRISRRNLSGAMPAPRGYVRRLRRAENSNVHSLLPRYTTWCLCVSVCVEHVCIPREQLLDASLLRNRISGSHCGFRRGQYNVCPLERLTPCFGVGRSVMRYHLWCTQQLQL